MVWFGKSFIKFCRSFINLIKLVGTQTRSSARVRVDNHELMIKSLLDNYEIWPKRPAWLTTNGNSGVWITGTDSYAIQNQFQADFNIIFKTGCKVKPS